MKLSLLHESIDQFMPIGHCSAQFGDCGIEVYQIAKQALKSGFRKFQVVEGMISDGGTMLPHTWIELPGGEIKDPTISQFAGDIEYSPAGEFRDVSSPREYVEDFEEQYGSLWSEEQPDGRRGLF